MRVLIGGVGYRWCRDGSFGLVASDLLAGLDWPEGIDVADLGYGALYASQDIGDAQPPYQRLILLAGVERGRDPGQLYRYEWDEPLPQPEEIQARVYEAGAGVIDIDHLLIIARYFGKLPAEVIVFELEPVESAGGIELTPLAESRLPEIVDLVRQEVLAPVRNLSGAA